MTGKSPYGLQKAGQLRGFKERWVKFLVTTGGHASSMENTMKMDDLGVPPWIGNSHLILVVKHQVLTLFAFFDRTCEC